MIWPVKYECHDALKRKQAMEMGYTPLISTNGYLYFIKVAYLVNKVPRNERMQCAFCLDQPTRGQWDNTDAPFTNIGHYFYTMPSANICPVCNGQKIV